MKYNENSLKDVAIYVCCYAGDYHLAKILCESIRYFCGQVPIFLIKDGDFSTSQVGSWEMSMNLTKRMFLSNWECGVGAYKNFMHFFSGIISGFFISMRILSSSRTLSPSPFESLTFTLTLQVLKTSMVLSRESVPVEVFPLAAARYTFGSNGEPGQFDPEFDLDNVLLFNSGQIFGQSGLLELDSVMHCVGELE